MRAVPATAWDDPTVSPGTTVSYVVTAVDRAGSVSPYSAPVTASMPPDRITIAWTSPVRSEDGSTCTDLKGFKVYQGTRSGVYDLTIDAGNVTQYIVPIKSMGSYYFRVTAYDASGNESQFSNELLYRTP